MSGLCLVRQGPWRASRRWGMGWPDVHAMPTAVCGSGAPRGSPLVPAVFQVALRIRPISVAELEEGAALIAHRVDEQVGPPPRPRLGQAQSRGPDPGARILGRGCRLYPGVEG